MSLIITVLIIFLVNVNLYLCSDSSSDRIKICINNCGQCKAMYGDFFMGQMCAESCLKFAKQIASHELVLPDCNSPKSILPFIRKLVGDNNLDVV